MPSRNPSLRAPLTAAKVRAVLRRAGWRECDGFNGDDGFCVDELPDGPRVTHVTDSGAFALLRVAQYAHSLRNGGINCEIIGNGAAVRCRGYLTPPSQESTST